jgi:hypothetical protein
MRDIAVKESGADRVGAGHRILTGTKQELIYSRLVRQSKLPMSEAAADPPAASCYFPVSQYRNRGISKA